MVISQYQHFAVHLVFTQKNVPQLKLLKFSTMKLSMFFYIIPLDEFMGKFMLHLAIKNKEFAWVSNCEFMLCEDFLCSIFVQKQMLMAI